MRGAKIIVKCKCCKEKFFARVADRNRGWAKFCSKSCKAKEQENRTGQYKKFKSASRDVEDSFHPFDSYSLGQE